jgi:tRNA 2-thiouridine synthesizing protein A
MSSERLDPAVDVVDARGLYCPLPVLRTRERFKALPPHSRLDVVADDPLARLDMQAFCRREGHAYLDEREEPGGGWRMALRKSEAFPRP